MNKFNKIYNNILNYINNSPIFVLVVISVFFYIPVITMSGGNRVILRFILSHLKYNIRFIIWRFLEIFYTAPKLLFIGATFFVNPLKRAREDSSSDTQPYNPCERAATMMNTLDQSFLNLSPEKRSWAEELVVTEINRNDYDPEATELLKIDIQVILSMKMLFNQIIKKSNAR